MLQQHQQKQSRTQSKSPIFSNRLIIVVFYPLIQYCRYFSLMRNFGYIYTKGVYSPSTSQVYCIILLCNKHCSLYCFRCLTYTYNTRTTLKCSACCAALLIENKISKILDTGNHKIIRLLWDVANNKDCSSYSKLNQQQINIS